MPYKVFEVEDQYCVFKLDAKENKTGSSLGCHPTEGEANDQVAALYAAEEQAMSEDEQARNLFDDIIQSFQKLRTFFVSRRIKDVDSWDGSPSQFESTDAYCAACLIDVNSEAGREEKAQSHCMLPVRGPGDSKDTFVRQGVHAAVAGHGISQVKKPEDVPQEAWDSAVASAKSQLRKAYGEMDEEPPESIARAMSLDAINERVFNVAIEKYPMAFFHSTFRDGDGQMFAILTQDDRLYRSPVTIAEDKSIELGEWFEVEQEFVPVQTRTTVLRQKDGQYRVISRSATAVLNRVDEIDSRELFDSFIKYLITHGAEGDGTYARATPESLEYFPSRQFWHQGKQFRTGQCDFVARDGYVLITSSLYDDSELAQLEREAIEREPDYWGESIRYKPTKWPTLITLENSKIIPVFRAGYLIEISTLPEDFAANLFTAVTQEVNRMLKGNVWEAFKKYFQNDEEKARKWLEENTDGVNREIEQQVENGDTIARSEDDKEKPKEEGENPTKNELVLDDEAIKAIVAQLQESEVIRSKANSDDVAKLVKMSEEVTRAIEKINDVFEDITARLEALEKDEDEKRREYQEDMPRNSKINVTYRPRVARADNGDGNEANELEAWQEQKKTNNIPSY